MLHESEGTIILIRPIMLSGEITELGPIKFLESGETIILVRPIMSVGQNQGFFKMVG
jgi:hypothetical protein